MWREFQSGADPPRCDLGAKRRRSVVGSNLLQPLGHPLLGLGLRNNLASGVELIEPTPEGLGHIKVVLHVIKSAVIGQAVQDRLNLLLWCGGCH
jgi:hypothetical protein